MLMHVLPVSAAVARVRVGFGGKTVGDLTLEAQAALLRMQIPHSWRRRPACSAEYNRPAVRTADTLRLLLLLTATFTAADNSVA